MVPAGVDHLQWNAAKMQPHWKPGSESHPVHFGRSGQIAGKVLSAAIALRECTKHLLRLCLELDMNSLCEQIVETLLMSQVSAAAAVEPSLSKLPLIARFETELTRSPFTPPFCNVVLRGHYKISMSTT
mmetsp:Transcript_27025/g.59341  ORF Transcript_27025/g.59341 Transcript_27025/m.59341 type:complete len:129 (+) Transcript_27025:380-766(+)